MPPAADLGVRRIDPADKPSPLHSAFLRDDLAVVIATDPEEIAAQLAGGQIAAFRQAGPREHLAFDAAHTTIGIVTCGGLCPGLNDVIRAVTRTALRRYGVKRVLGFRYGYSGLVSEWGHEPWDLSLDDVALVHRSGGSMLGVSRGHQKPDAMVDGLLKHGVDTLIAIGGDGTLRGVHELCGEIEQRDARINVVGVPKTIDNDVGWVQRSFGLDTAVAVASEALSVASTEARSAWGGVGLVRLMGRESGFITAFASLASGVVDFCLIPESPFEIEGKDGLLDALEAKLNRSHAAVIAVAEGAGRDVLGVASVDESGNEIPHDIGLHLRDRIRKEMAARGVTVDMKYIDPSYTVRGVPATANDSVFCARLGQHAVHAAMAGFTDIVIGHWNEHFTLVPTTIATAERQRVHLDSSLWRSVLQLTGQKLGSSRSGSA
ncbi:MAG: ATP-dependent 6-phosphofructokinase [Candidatus Binatia bacterium]|nr:ATP-dependent 6-phosphofructokinase [Candidatus Binatia bacterium]